MYKHILLATDLIFTAKQTALDAQEIAKQNGARLSLVHIIEPISTYSLPLVVDIGIERSKHAKEELSRLKVWPRPQRMCWSGLIMPTV